MHVHCFLWRVTMESKDQPKMSSKQKMPQFIGNDLISLLQRRNKILHLLYHILSMHPCSITNCTSLHFRIRICYHKGPPRSYDAWIPNT